MKLFILVPRRMNLFQQVADYFVTEFTVLLHLIFPRYTKFLAYSDIVDTAYIKIFLKNVCLIDGLYSIIDVSQHINVENWSASYVRSCFPN